MVSVTLKVKIEEKILIVVAGMQGNKITQYVILLL